MNKIYVEFTMNYLVFLRNNTYFLLTKIQAVYNFFFIKGYIIFKQLNKPVASIGDTTNKILKSDYIQYSYRRKSLFEIAYNISSA